jgi:hypothetical protein
MRRRGVKVLSVILSIALTVVLNGATPARSTTAGATAAATATPTPSAHATATTTGKPAGPRVLSVSYNIPRGSTAQDIVNTVNAAYSLGVRGAYIDAPWSSLEPSPGVFQLANVASQLAYFGNKRKFTILLNLKVADTLHKATPADLASVPYDDPQMMQRFHALFQSVLPYLNTQVKYLSLGNEVDTYLQTPGDFSAYKAFLKDAISYVHHAAPWIKVGTTVTFRGATGPSAAQIADLTSVSDIYILTYYPIDTNENVLDPNSPTTDLPKMVSLAGKKPVVLQEVGYPTSSVIRSSEQKQSQFIHSVFAAWRKAGSSIPFINYFAFYDYDPATCDAYLQFLQKYNVNTANFRAYLCTLGIAKSLAAHKASWHEFSTDASLVVAPSPTPTPAPATTRTPAATRTPTATPTPSSS